MKTRLRLVLLSPVFRWGLVVLVLLAAGAVAFWPRTPDGQAAAEPPAPPPTSSTAEKPAGDLAAIPCPSVTAGASGTLRGLGAQCLGSGRAVDAAGALTGRDGRPTLVNVWASWCPPCRAELPVLQRYARTAGAVRVVGLQVSSDPAQGRALLRRLGVRLPMLYDNTDAVQKALHVPYALPASYLVDSRGSATFIGDPRLFRSVPDVRAAVARYGRG